MNAQLQPPQVPSYDPADFLDPASFIQARHEAWRAVCSDINPGNEIVPVLESAWTVEWMRCHERRITLALTCTAGVASEELGRYVDLGGLRTFVADYRAVRGTTVAQQEHIGALQAALRSIAEHRHVHASSQTPEQMLEGIALKAFEALAYGRLPVPAPSAPAASALEQQCAPEAGGRPDGVDLDAAAQLIEQAQVNAEVEGEPRSMSEPKDEGLNGVENKRRFHTKVDEGLKVMTAQRFMAMAGVRNLSDQDGAAHPSDGIHYDPLTTLSPARPVPAGITHIVWKEFAAQPVSA